MKKGQIKIERATTYIMVETKNAREMLFKHQIVDELIKEKEMFKTIIKKVLHSRQTTKEEEYQRLNNMLEDLE